MEKHFLEQYKTQDKPEAKKAAERKEQRTGEKGIFKDRSERIRAYVERLENVFLNPDQRVQERNTELLKPTIYENTLIKPEDFPKTHFEFHKQQLVDRGIPREQVEQNFDAEKREQEISRVIESQKMSLDSWIDYLTGDDCKYPPDVKYFAIHGVLRLGTFDTEKYSFTKRLPTTTAPFAEIDHEALSVVLGAVEAKNYSKPTETYSKNLLRLIDQGNSFGDMYALTMRELDQKTEKSDLLPIVDGEWRVFDKNSDPQELVNALSGKRSNLCIADIGSATTYLNQGSVEVYFSYNKAKQLTVPRIAIAHDEEKGGVYEVRGTYNKSEDTDSYIQESGVLTRKLKDLPNGESFAKKDADMKEVTKLYKKCFSIDRKTKEKISLNPTFTREELQFLYEINGTVQGFGYQKDPRIEEIKSKRNREEDIQTLCDCSPEYIATDFININESTQVYCEDGGNKITFFDFREEQNKKKIPQLIELAKGIKESGSQARPDMSFEGGIVTIDIPEEKLKDTKTALQSYEGADNKSPSWAWPEWINAPYTKPKLPLETIILSYNKDTNTRVSSDKIVVDMDKLNLRPATLEEMIVLGIVKPEFNKRSGTYLVGLTKYALGGGSHVPVLYWRGDGRQLGRNRWANEWPDWNRFVCVRK